MGINFRYRRTAHQATAAIGSTHVFLLLLLLFLVSSFSPATAGPLQFVQADAAEISFWESIKDSNNPAELKAYLSAYPQGTFTALARIRLNELKAQTKPSETATQEQADGDTVSPPTQECDSLAADSNDADRKAEAVLYDKLDAERAAQACEQAVASYPGVARFEYQLGRALEKAKRYAEALEWFRKAAEKDYAAAMTFIGVMYGEGHGVATDNGLAAEWFRKAAEKGDRFAKFALGFAHENGLGVAKDEAQAIEWYLKAAQQGDDDAVHNLGLMYATGRGVAKDEAQAAEWFRKAAEKGDRFAEYSLGHAYEQGKGVPKDLAEGLKWYRMAAKHNEERAIKRLRELGEPVPAPDESEPETGTGGLTADDLGKLD